jgi:acyl carrier protein
LEAHENAFGLKRSDVQGIPQYDKCICRSGAVECCDSEGESMDHRDRIVQAIYKAVDELNKQLPAGTSLEKSPEATLYGKSSKLESLDFVTFIMEVEEKVNDEFGTNVMITDENLLSKEKSPFSTLGTLTDYLAEVLKNTQPA